MAVSTGERKRKSDGKEYETPPPLPCTPKELDVLLNKWIEDGVFKPNQVSKEPAKEERRDSRFCHLHNYVKHPTVEYWVFCRLVHQRVKEGTLELSQPEVQRKLLPNHKGKGVAVVFICAGPGENEEERLTLPDVAIATLQKCYRFKNLFNQFKLTVNERRMATEALVSIATRAGVECLSAKAKADKALLQDTNKINFSDEDM